MNSKLIRNIAEKLKRNYNQLIFVSNPDGFLSKDIVCEQLRCEHDINVIKGSRIELRIHFELVYKSHPDHYYIYLVENAKSLLPDMRQEGSVMDFSISDLFPFFANKQIIRGQSLEVIETLFEKYSTKQIRLSQCTTIIEDIKQKLQDSKQTSLEELRNNLERINVDWQNQKDTICNVSTILANAIKSEVIDELEQSISIINNKFQEWIDNNYFATLRSSSLLAKSVNNILPFINSKHEHNEKVALFVVDGFSYWQYTILKKYLEKAKIKAQDGATLSWLPSITMLSRQAIFRGGDPDFNYKQNQDNEKKLWIEYWKENNFDSIEILYLGDKDEKVINDNVKRLALVTTEMDDKMHATTDYKELWLLTDYWCSHIVETINMVLNNGFVMYLTTDHGSTLSTGLRPLTQGEKVYLYKDGSRGKRHLIYNDETGLADFMCSNSELGLLHNDKWLCIRDNKCFASESKRIITHGGSHFMEVVIPFIKITK